MYNIIYLLLFFFLDGSDFLINGGQFFIFDPDTRSHSFSIAVVDDDVFEDYEIFFVSLSTNTTNLVSFAVTPLLIEDDDSKLNDSV